MTTTKHHLAGLALAMCLAWSAQRSAVATTAGFDVPLSLPRIETLSTAIAAPGGAVVLDLRIGYDAAGKLIVTPESTCDGTAVAGSGSARAKNGVVTYKIAAKSADPKIAVAISGVVGAATATCGYAGPKGKVVLPANPVDLTSAPVTLNVTLDFVPDPKGNLVGAGTITGGYADDGTAVAALKGKAASGKVKWQLTAGRRKLGFSGTAEANSWQGTLSVAVPPDKERLSGFTIPVAGAGADTATFRGVIAIDSGAGPLPAAGASVSFRCDADGDGTTSAEEEATATTDADGRYELAVAVAEGRRVLGRFALDGCAELHRAFATVSPGATVTLNATLRAVAALAVADGTARSDDGTLTLSGLPADVVAVKGRVFNPASESGHFPGEFADDSGNLLVSSVFATVTATNAAGAAVKTFKTPPTLSMQVPADTWSTLRDLTPGNGRIDVPLYSFDEEAGLWRRAESDGWLLDGTDAVIPEADLAAIQQGAYASAVFVTGPVAHLSYWNLDWPVDTHGCIEGRIVTESGTAPVAGASVTVSGTTYTGASAPTVTAADGYFCSEAMRSEAAGEDVDEDGVPGETQEVDVVVSVAGTYYRFGPFALPETQGACGGTNCLDVGTLQLSPENQLTLQVCALTGTVVYSGVSLHGDPGLTPGDPIPGAMVYGYDPEAQEAFTDCMVAGTCQPFGITDESGGFSLAVPVLSSLFVAVSKDLSSGDPHEIAFAYGQVAAPTCPGAPLIIRADALVYRWMFATMTGGGTAAGVLSVADDQATCSFLIGDTTYVGLAAPVPALPGTPGPWLTMDLYSGSSPDAVGTVVFTVDAVAGGVYSGSWSAAVLGVSGTWTEGMAKAPRP